MENVVRGLNRENDQLQIAATHEPRKPYRLPAFSSRGGNGELNLFLGGTGGMCSRQGDADQRYGCGHEADYLGSFFFLGVIWVGMQTPASGANAGGFVMSVASFAQY